MMADQYVSSISVRGYRNIRSADLDFSPGINLIYGENAQGKTNLIESIWLLSGGKSFRGSRDRDMIGFDLDDFRIEGKVRDGEDEISIVIACSRNNPRFATRMARLNGGDFTAPSRIAGSFYCVVFSPVHLNIVSGSPALRRKFMDACLCQLYPGFIDNWRRYNHALSVRNSFLKEIRKYDDAHAAAMFDTLDEALSVYGSEMDRYRKDFCAFVSARAREYYSRMSRGREKVTLTYSPCAENRDEIKRKLLESRDRDIAAGSTSFGPHKEDIEILIDGRSARTYASQGQQRSIVVAMKLAESDVMEEVTGTGPVILLDDVLSELDSSRQDYLINRVRGKQIFITSCDSDRIQKSQSRKIRVEGGRFFEEER